MLWAIQDVNWITGYCLNPAFGLIPRYFDGLDGIIAMPFLHGSFGHLMANMPPLLVMGGLLVATTTRALLRVNAVVIGLGGGLVWLFGSSAIHVGASALVFGWFGFGASKSCCDVKLARTADELVAEGLARSKTQGSFCLFRRVFARTSVAFVPHYSAMLLRACHEHRREAPK